MSLPEVYFESLSEIDFTCGVLLAAVSLEYGVTPVSFSYERETRWEPAGGEVELPSFVAIYANGEKVGHTTWNVFILDYASYHKISLDRAERKLYQVCYESMDDRDGEESEYEA